MDRSIVLNEFLELRKLLNQQNKIADVKTEFQFNIERVRTSEFRLMAVVFGNGENNKIEILNRNRQENWERSGYTKFINFENYCADFLNNLETKEQPLYQKKSTSKYRLEKMVGALQNDFDNLVIGQAP